MKEVKTITPVGSQAEGRGRCAPTVASPVLAGLRRWWEREAKEWQVRQQWIRALAHPLRLGIMLLLAKGEFCVCDLAAIFQESVTNLSHQLRRLREEGWVAVRTRGRTRIYHLTPQGRRILSWVLSLPEEEIRDKRHERRLLWERSTI